MAELKIVISTVDQSSKQIGAIESQIKKLATTAAQIYLLKQGFDFLRDSINKAAQEEKNLRTLQTVIENQGDSWARVGTKVKDYISTMEYNSMFTDAQLIPSMKQLINAGMNTEQAMRALSTATDLATAKGLDLETAANLLGKAYMGNTDLLKRYGIQGKDFNEVMDETNRKFGGSARKDMDSYAGNVKKLETSWEQFQKTIGRDVIPMVNKLVIALDVLLGGAKAPTMTPNEIALKNVTDRLAEMEKQGKATTKAYKDLQSAQQEWMLIVGLEKQKQVKGDNVPFTPQTSNKDKAELDKQEKDAEDIINKYNTFKEDQRLKDYNNGLEMDKLDQTNKEAMAKADIEREQLKWTAIYDIAGSTSQAMTALGVATNSALLKSIGVVLNGVQTVIRGVEAIVSGGVVGTILGILGIITGVANTTSYLNQLSALEKQNMDLGNAGITPTTATNTKLSELPKSVVSTTIPESIERAPAPTYNNYQLNYNIYTGVILGDDRTLDNAFDILMKRYENRLQLRVS